MTGWLTPVVDVLSRRPDLPLRCFVRDDDGGWDDARLLKLMDRLQLLRVPMDVAIIPTALSRNLARELQDRKRCSPDQVGFHQHGYRHVNHETAGRKCEFGPDRSVSLQLDDIASGQALLNDTMGAFICDRIFTPPWNRCTQQTVLALQTLGFAALSRNRGAQVLQTGTLVELSVDFDWQRQRPDREALAEEFAAKLQTASSDTDQAFGIMLHHAVMTPADLQNFTELLQLLMDAHYVEFHLMYDLLSPSHQDPGVVSALSPPLIKRR